jgi:hypothetical protein
MLATVEVSWCGRPDLNRREEERSRRGIGEAFVVVGTPSAGIVI